MHQALAQSTVQAGLGTAGALDHTPVRNWFVVIAKPNQDFLVAKGLREQDFAEVYLPKTFKRVKTKEGMKAHGSLLLSPYLFVLMDISCGEHGPIKNTRGVQELICGRAGNPRKLRDGPGVIGRMRQAEDEELFTATMSSKMIASDIKRGALVRIDRAGLLPNYRHDEERQVTGRVLGFRSRKVEVLVGTMTWLIDPADLTELK